MGLIIFCVKQIIDMHRLSKMLIVGHFSSLAFSVCYMTMFGRITVVY